ncbi:hypothetical protein [Paracerasibacillus soli]|uniref:Uncharacterized protein n=1 Tax=Paracerasibacillus soli TaxID=480284 RepID=A0ABU5CRH9_9BACI|nr:hypothetical protein [Virgibacillus soli]MDY0408476.1 hypothetical protein [Virgibacillus soli]
MVYDFYTGLHIRYIHLFVTLNNVYTKTYDIERFSNARETIRSPITIENEQETEKNIREAVQSVPESIYDIG